MTTSQHNTVEELDAAYEPELFLTTIQDLRHLTGPALFKDARAEITERQTACGLPRLEAARLVLADYKVGK